MHELKILKAALTREYFNTCELVGIAASLSPTGKELYTRIKEYYERDAETETADIEVIASTLYAQHSKNEAAFSPMIQRIIEIPISADNLMDSLLRQAERAKRLEVAALLANESSNNEAIDDALDELAQLRAGLLKEDAFVGKLPITELFQRDGEKPFALLSPNMDLLCKGGAEEQHHIVIFARPESGKTAAALTLCRRNAWNKNKRVMYVCNEDADKSIQRRAICNWTNLSEEQLLSRDPYEVEEWLLNNGYDNLIFVSGEHQSMPSIEALVRKHQPNMLIVDQIRNLSGDTNMTVKLDTVGRAMRRLAKVYNLCTVSITQAGESGADKLFLHAEDIEWSNTGLQGSADILLGIGIKEENRYTLGMQICKNKTGGGHGSWTMRLHHTTSRVGDEIKLTDRV